MQELINKTQKELEALCAEEIELAEKKRALCKSIEADTQANDLTKEFNPDINKLMKAADYYVSGCLCSMRECCNVCSRSSDDIKQEALSRQLALRLLETDHQIFGVKYLIEWKNGVKYFNDTDIEKINLFKNKIEELKNIQREINNNFDKILYARRTLQELAELGRLQEKYR